MKRSFHALSLRLVGFENTGVFCLAFLFNDTSFPVLLALKILQRIAAGWHRSFQLSTRVVHNVFEFFISWINELNTAQFSCIVMLRFFDSPLLLFFAFRRFRHILPNLWPPSVWPGSRLLSCQFLPDHVYPSGGFSSKKVNIVKPVHVSDNSRSLSTFQ